MCVKFIKQILVGETPLNMLYKDKTGQMCTMANFCTRVKNINKVKLQHKLIKKNIYIDRGLEVIVIENKNLLKKLMKNKLEKKYRPRVTGDSGSKKKSIFLQPVQTWPFVHIRLLPRKNLFLIIVIR